MPRKNPRAATKASLRIITRSRRSGRACGDRGVGLGPGGEAHAGAEGRSSGGPIAGRHWAFGGFGVLVGH